MNDKEKDIGNVKSVVVYKDNLLRVIRENKAKHDAIFDAALSGYWIASKEKILKKQESFKDYVTVLQQDFAKSAEIMLSKIENKNRSISSYGSIPIPNASFSYSVDLRYPESHSDDYERAIKAVELSVYDKIELTEIEFNQYIMNNWTWRSSFISSNTDYAYSGVCFTTGFYANAIAISGCNNIF